MLFLSAVILVLKVLKLLDISWQATWAIISLALSIKVIKLLKREQDNSKG